MIFFSLLFAPYFEESTRVTTTMTIKNQSIIFLLNKFTDNYENNITFKYFHFIVENYKNCNIDTMPKFIFILKPVIQFLQIDMKLGPGLLLKCLKRLRIVH